MCSCLNVRKLLFGSKNTTVQEESQLEEAVYDKKKYTVASNNDKEINLTTTNAAKWQRNYDNGKYDEQGFKGQDKEFNIVDNDNDDNDVKRQKRFEKRKAINEPQEMIEEIDEHMVAATMKNNNNDDDIPNYIGEYKTFVEEKPLTTASTPYSAMVDGFDFEKWFNNNNHNPSMMMYNNKRKRHSSGGEESEYTIKAAAEYDDTVAPLLSDHRPTRPLTLPKGGLTLEHTDATFNNQSHFQREAESVLLVNSSNNRLLLTQRHSRSHGRLNHHQLMRHALENSFMLQQAQSNFEYVVDEDDIDNDNNDEDMVVLRRRNYADNARST